MEPDCKAKECYLEVLCMFVDTVRTMRTLSTKAASMLTPVTLLVLSLLPFLRPLL